MIDIQLLRKNPQEVAKRLATRGRGAFDREQFERFEATRKGLQSAVEQARASQNRVAKDIGQAKAKGQDASELMREAEKQKSLLKESEQQLEKLQAGLQDLLARIPNIPHESVPVGKSSEDNPERRRWGTPRKFSFPVKDHVDVGEGLGGLDFAAATKIAGSRFVLMRGEVAQLHRALAQFMLNTHTREHGYTEIYTPYIVNSASAYGTGQLPKFEQDLFAVPHGEGKSYLLPTAEVPVTNIVRDEIVELEEPAAEIRLPFAVLPLRGGLVRQGHARHDPQPPVRQGRAGARSCTRRSPTRRWKSSPATPRRILKKLELPYRVVELCTGDIGAAAAKTYDLEVWLPAQNAYREISSCSNFEAYQARRMQARFRAESGKPELVHTLNGSGLAVGRTLVAILENYQNADGSVTIPTALRPYLRRPETGSRGPPDKIRGSFRPRRDGRVVDCGRLEICCTREGTGGSNPSLSAISL